MDGHRADVIVVGGGLAGLAAAAYLRGRAGRSWSSRMVLACRIDDGHIRELYSVLASRKLTAVRPPS